MVEAVEVDTQAEEAVEEVTLPLLLHHHHHHRHHRQHQLQLQQSRAEADTLNKQVVVLIRDAPDSRASSTRHNVPSLPNAPFCCCCEDEDVVVVISRRISWYSFAPPTPEDDSTISSLLCFIPSDVSVGGTSNQTVSCI